MLGIITLLIGLSAQIGFLVYQLATKNRQSKVRHIIQIAAFATLSLLLVTGVYWWGFRWVGLFTYMSFKTFLRRCLLEYFIITTCITAATAILGLTLNPAASDINKMLKSLQGSR